MVTFKVDRYKFSKHKGFANSYDVCKNYVNYPYLS